MMKGDLTEIFDMDFKGELWIKSYTEIGNCCGKGDVLARDSYSGE